MFNRNVSNRLMSTIFVTQSLFSGSQIAIITLLSIVAVKLGGSDSLAGIPSSTMTFVQAFAAYPMGYLMGKFGRRLGLSLGYSAAALGGVLGVVAILQGSFFLFLISAGLLGVGRAGSDLSRFAVGEIYPENVRARMIGRIVFAGTIGAIGGPLLVSPSSQIATQLGMDSHIGPWLISIGTFGLAALIAYLLLRPDPSKIAREIEAEEDIVKPKDPNKLVRPLKEILKDPLVLLAILGMAISTGVMSLMMVITPLHMHHGGYESDYVALVISSHTLGMFGLSALTGYLIDRYGRIVMMAVGAFTLIISAIIAPMSNDLYILLISLFLVGLGWNFCYITGSSILSDVLTGQERTRTQGFNDMVRAGASGFGGIGSGIFFGIGGYLAVSAVSLLFSVMLLVLVRWLSPASLEVQPV